MTAVLEDLNTVQGSSHRVFNTCFKTANTLVESVRPFTKHVNALEEMYTRAHLFFVMYHKVMLGFYDFNNLQLSILGKSLGLEPVVWYT